MSEVGYCTNTACERATTHDPVERYPGPGEYCPSCGEPLKASKKPRRRLWLVGPLIGIFVLSGFAGWKWTAFNVRVCATSMTDGVANSLVNAYSAQHGSFPYHYTITRPENLPCDVRFLATAANADGSSVIARDGIVAIVNPSNPVTQLSRAQLRDIYAGHSTDWSQAGWSGKIVPVMPADDSDEARGAAALLGAEVEGSVMRLHDATQIVRLVSSPSGLRAISLVPFSASVGAKVLAIAGSPPPSTLSIVDERYPLFVRLVVGSDFRHPVQSAADLIEFARSDKADEYIGHLALVTRNN